MWQLDEPAKAALALAKAQATQVYAGLKLWPDAVVAKLIEMQLVADGTYPNAAAVLAEQADVTASAEASPTLDYDPTQPRDLWGRWTNGGAGTSAPAAAVEATVTSTKNQAAPRTGGLTWLLHELNPIGTAQAQGVPPEPPGRREAEPAAADELQPGEVMRIQRFNEAWKALERINPRSRAFEFLREPGALPSEAEIAQLEVAVQDEYIKRTCDFLRPDGKPIGQLGTSTRTRLMLEGLAAAQQDYDYLSEGATPVPFNKGSMVRLPYGDDRIIFRPTTSTQESPAIDVVIPGVITRKLYY